MRRISLLATLALCAVSALAGGAVVRLVGLSGDSAAATTLLFAGGVVALGLGGGLASRPNGRTSYWR